jgi:hypothetical protein
MIDKWLHVLKVIKSWKYNKVCKIKTKAITCVWVEPNLVEMASLVNVRKFLAMCVIFFTPLPHHQSKNNLAYKETTND